MSDSRQKYCPTAFPESSELDEQFHPCSPRRARSEERRALQREIPGLISRRVCRERSCEESTLRGQSRIRELRRGVVMAVEKIVDLNGELKPFGQIIVSAEVGDHVAGRDSGSEIVEAV